MSTSAVEAAAAPPPAAGPPVDPPDDPRGEEPIRGELFGAEYLEAHARGRATSCTLAGPRRSGSPLLARFAENGRVLVQAHRAILDHDARGEPRELDAEWLADNFHIVEDVLREVRHDLPRGYDSELPKLIDGPLSHYPRVYALALDLVAHTDSGLDESRISHYVGAFQEAAPLTIGELWAVPTMLRLVLLENLRRLAEQMLRGWHDGAEAKAWAARLLAQDDGLRPSPAPSLSDPFVVRLLQSVRDQGPKGSAILERLEAQLGERGVDANEVLRREHRRQAANQVSVGNCVTSLRLLSALDWNTFFERQSRVEAALREDPAGVYARQDFATRDRYRKAVEKVARGSRVEEMAVARRVVAMAAQGLASDLRRGHVGYYLIDRGLSALKAEFGYRTPIRERLHASAIGHPRALYFGAVAAVALVLIAGLVVAGGGAEAGGWRLVLLILALILPVSELAVGLVNHLLTRLLPPRVLPKLEFKEGIAADCQTMVVMPSMLVRAQSAAVLLERLEIHYLANPDPQLRFALLTDFADAPGEEMPEDQSYVQAALEGVKDLNDRYARGGPDRFFVFHRRRLWNPDQGAWMGWERKRGKLSEFNQLLRGSTETSYSVLSGEIGQGPPVRFVITLDADTQLPRESASRLVGTIAHPLVRPRFDPAARRVVEGHGVLQPRVSYHLTAATRSRFAGVLASSAGIDPYATAVSDTYMDLFGSGSFTGKGIYDVDAFEAATGHTFPENRILSHDLIEGNYARCGLVTDIELFDDFPPRYHAYARREHRWVRGDWQLLPWLAPRVPTPAGPRANPLPTLERWKVADNLRRSLVPPATLTLLALGWTVLPGSPWTWTAAALAVPALPLIQLLLGTTLGAVRGRSLAGLRGLRDSLPPTAAQAGMAAAFLADQARLMTDAIGRTLYRLTVTRNQMLEWETAASTERRLGTGIAQFFQTMWPAPALAVGLAALVALAQPRALWAATPVLLAWLLSPLVAYWVSRPKRAAQSPLTASEREALGRVARKTWHFFETFVGDADHWLPPDNFQEVPDGRIAHRTSPTNQGLLLLSTLAAHDFGYLGLRTLVHRLEKTFHTLESLERHQGHFYNWYQTQTLQPLPPAYVSTVDSGNFLGCLVALRHGMEEKAREPILGPSVRGGLVDTLSVLVELLKQIRPTADPAALEIQRSLERDARSLRERLDEAPSDLLSWDEWLGREDWAAVGLIGRIRALAAAGVDFPAAVEAWARRFLAQVRERRAELAAIAPWLHPLKLAGPAADAIRADLVANGSVVEIASRAAAALCVLKAEGGESPALRELVACLRDGTALDLSTRCRHLAQRSAKLGAEMDFRFLYKPDRHLFAIGCNLAQGRLDGACYDLLASESCLTSFLTIARGEVPRRHWFQLGRPFIRAGGHVGLLSWGGTMFEYLMPRLLIKSLPGTLVAEAAEAAVGRQVEYGRQAGVPWGISESSFSAQYLDGDYQYQSFGVPGLGLKRGLARDLVIAPYATALAVMIQPRAALENFRRLSAEGAEGAYGFYEAIDYTVDRLPKGSKSAVVRSFMAHHQGMGLVALANALLDEPMPRRFQAEAMVRAAELLLQERVPREVPLIEPSESDAAAEPGASPTAPQLSRRLTTASTPVPRTLLLSNSQYHVMLTNSGAGYSVCRGLDVTRWREDATRDHWGQFLFVRDPEGGAPWSAGFQPTCRPPEDYEVTFSADKATFRRLDGTIETLLEVTVSPEALAEFRRVTLTNHDNRSREIELTSYVEIALASRTADSAHPAFGKLFQETEWVPGAEALLCRRRPRSPEQPPVWAVHVSTPSGEAVEYETDRARFLGRGRTPADPAAMDPGAVLSGTTGPVLDPVLSLRRRVRLEPGTSASVSFTTAVADTRVEAHSLADQFRDPGAVARAFELAWAHSQVEHRHRPWSAEQAHLYQRLAAHVLFAGSALRAAPAAITANRQGTMGLWRHGISGDMPIILVRVAETDGLALARELVEAHEYLRLKGLEVDLVLWNEQPTSYFEEMHQQLLEMVRGNDFVDKPGGIFVRKAAHAPEEDKRLLQAAARVVLGGDRGPLAGQLDRIERMPTLPEPFPAHREPAQWPIDEAAPPADLLFPNGLGGFTLDGREYGIAIRDGQAGGHSPPRPILPPAPWINVVANPLCGFLASDAGLGYTWAGNSQTNRLTPWSNDPVSDPPGEVLYLRDEDDGAFWTPTALPIASRTTAHVRHGQGYTVFERRDHGLGQALTVFVAPDDPIKLLQLVVTNLSAKPRRLSATYYAEWVLGTTREQAPLGVVTEVDPISGALLARHAFNPDFGSKLAFADVFRRPRTLTADRAEFLGRNGSVIAPAALRRIELSGRFGAALDPCAAIQTPFALAPGETIEVVFAIGQADGVEDVRRLLRVYREPGQVSSALAEVRARWEATLGVAQVRTPDPAMDLMLNRWLLYQTLSCRVWGRSAFYQSGGAYGFRDQLQDVMALVHGAPGEVRAQLLRAAARQFVEGDVQHWWHPPAGRGVRTRISDDYLWLPFVACHYAEATGDFAVFDDTAPFLKALVLKPGQEEDYGQPATTEEAATLYEHCVRALEHSDHLGAHGLPLMGTGDWNDGMNRVGSEGAGESVWVAWFLLATLNRFASVAEARRDSVLAARCRARAEALRVAVEAHAWDGDWYRRAYFDDGTPLGSAGNEECRIDSIAQSWAVISGVADTDRARRALKAVDEQLVRLEDGLILLFTPPFDTGSLQPGYIKGYVPGIRENGGQYTHAATWVAQAAALLGQGRRARDLFDLLNPVRHAADPESVARYKVEPYVVAADIYGRPPHTGRGGWTWYTGSSAWLYRVGLESILGLKRRGPTLEIVPCIPADWPGFEIAYRFQSSTYRIRVENPEGVEHGVRAIHLDGTPCPGGIVPLLVDGREHEVRVQMGRVDREGSP